MWRWMKCYDSIRTYNALAASRLGCHCCKDLRCTGYTDSNWVQEVIKVNSTESKWFPMSTSKWTWLCRRNSVKLCHIGGEQCLEPFCGQGCSVGHSRAYQLYFPHQKKQTKYSKLDVYVNRYIYTYVSQCIIYHLSLYIFACNVIRYDSDRYVHRLAETSTAPKRPKMQASDAGFCSQAALRAAEAAILEAVEVGDRHPNRHHIYADFIHFHTTKYTKHKKHKWFGCTQNFVRFLPRMFWGFGGAAFERGWRGLCVVVSHM